MAKVDLGELRIEHPFASAPRMTRVRLIDGPCAGSWAEVPERRELWQRVGQPGKPGVDSQIWARYDYLRPGAYTYSGIAVTTDQLAHALGAMQRSGHTYGESHGV